MPKAKFMRADFPMMRANRTSFERRVIYPTDRDSVEAQGYLVAHCLAACDLEVYALTLFFDHGHYDLGHPPADAAPEVCARFSDFYWMFHRLWWRVLRRHGWKHGPAYNLRERTHDAPSLGPDETLRAIVYDMAQAVDAGLYRRAADYPGLCLLPENVTTPRVFERNALIHAIDPDGELFPHAELSIQLSVPAQFAHLGRERYQALLRARLDEYQVEKAKAGARKSRGDYACRTASVGKQFEKHLRRLKTRGKLPPPENTPGPPPPYSSSTELRQSFMRERDDFWDQLATAVEQLKAGKTGVGFPAGTYGYVRRLNVTLECSGPPCWLDQPKWWPD